jgi:hypothetical protein
MDPTTTSKVIKTKPICVSKSHFFALLLSNVHTLIKYIANISIYFFNDCDSVKFVRFEKGLHGSSPGDRTCILICPKFWGFF